MAKRCLIILMSIMFFTVSLYAEKGESKKHIIGYVGINPFSVFSFFRSDIGDTLKDYGISTEQEKGLVIYGGFYPAIGHSFELRTSTGNMKHSRDKGEFEFGYIWYPFESLFKWSGGPLAGIMINTHIEKNNTTNIWNINHTSEFITGWRLILRPIIFDIRVGWDIATLKYTNKSYSKPDFAWENINDNLRLTFGVAFAFGKR